MTIVFAATTKFVEIVQAKRRTATCAAGGQRAEAGQSATDMQNRRCEARDRRVGSARNRIDAKSAC
ncbi:hypothetical protein DB771_00035 [Burkholderia sp. AU29985]|nr:hypothetical protein XM57_12145 [Burkholderia cepacia]AYZ98396.1 hypothetical protein EGY28_26245 [Burkholderia dolosa]ETP66835.1 hypothetical protein BDSB_08865 [Burkholderia dolosa PC543]PRE41073.1 hypothetical protein C6P87_28145 [Burkholderia sp. AU12872]PUA78868.1 hypothetical protein DB771_00035 [Burkholderia sp. AU29985]